jgi:alkaline phosphatase
VRRPRLPLESETHSGEDITVHAIGPWSHLFQGVVEQQYLFHVMDHATKISEQANNQTQRASAQ